MSDVSSASTMARLKTDDILDVPAEVGSEQPPSPRGGPGRSRRPDYGWRR